jgi:hypothetical protein
MSALKLYLIFFVLIVSIFFSAMLMYKYYIVPKERQFGVIEIMEDKDDTPVKIFACNNFKIDEIKIK